jgi:hypothetical protein
VVVVEVAGSQIQVLLVVAVVGAVLVPVEQVRLVGMQPQIQVQVVGAAQIPTELVAMVVRVWLFSVS